MDDRLKISLLLEFYGNLLTKKQCEMLSLHYNMDYSLAEIADEYHITRQGAFDNIRRGRQSLLELEDKLKLCGKFENNIKAAKRVLEYLEKIDKSKLDDVSVEYLDKIAKEVTKLSE
ncbi:MAG: hypothetical protein J6Y29_03430 [Clostridiales bacterium]|nr:hypothetical protein [Clostridiales bacterium]